MVGGRQRSRCGRRRDRDRSQGRPLTPGLFGGITGLGIEEVEQEPSTVDRSTVYGDGASGAGFVPRPEFDVTRRLQPGLRGRSASIVSKASRSRWSRRPHCRMGRCSPARAPSPASTAAPDPFVAGSRTLFVDLGANATAGSARAAPRSSCCSSRRRVRHGLARRRATATCACSRRPDARYWPATWLAAAIAFSVERAADIRQVLAWSERNGVRPVIVGGAQAWQVAPLLAKSHVPVVLDPLVDLPGTFDQLGASMENAALLHRAGVPITFTHFIAPTANARKVRQAAGVAVAHGLPWDAALAALTTTPAEVFGARRRNSDASRRVRRRTSCSGRVTRSRSRRSPSRSGSGARRSRCARGSRSCAIVTCRAHRSPGACSRRTGR